MQTSNRENPVKNNIAEMISTIEKLSVRLPFALVNENVITDNESIVSAFATLTENLKSLPKYNQ